MQSLGNATRPKPRKTIFKKVPYRLQTKITHALNVNPLMLKFHLMMKYRDVPMMVALRYMMKFWINAFFTRLQTVNPPILTYTDMKGNTTQHSVKELQ